MLGRQRHVEPVASWIGSAGEEASQGTDHGGGTRSWRPGRRLLGVPVAAAGCKGGVRAPRGGREAQRQWQGRAAASRTRVGRGGRRPAGRAWVKEGGGWRTCDGGSDVTARPGRVRMALCVISELVMCGVRRMGRAHSS
jgi:hypothetical protein